MAANHAKITVHFDRMTEMFGINGAGRMHRALLHGQITPKLRAKVRQVVVHAQTKQKAN